MLGLHGLGKSIEESVAKVGPVMLGRDMDIHDYMDRFVLPVGVMAEAVDVWRTDPRLTVDLPGYPFQALYNRAHALDASFLIPG